MELVVSGYKDNRNGSFCRGRLGLFFQQKIALIQTQRAKRQRKGRNPKTGAEMVIREHNVLSFKASPSMKKTVATTQVVSNP